MEMPSAETFDCFLSHNSRDKPAVRALAARLRARGLTVWLDEEQLRPGLPWQPLLESGIRASKSVAVLVGADGLGPWEQEEMRAALTLAVKDGRPVILVLLPDAPSAPQLPLFVGERTCVDLREDSDPEARSGLDGLYWGITGRRSDTEATPPGPRPRPPPMDPVEGRISELRRQLFQARSLADLQRLRNRATALQREHSLHAEVMDLGDEVERAFQAEASRLPRPTAAAPPGGPTRGPSFVWTALAGALSIAFVALGVRVWSWLDRSPPVPGLVHRPDPAWIAQWKGQVSGIDPAPLTLRIEIGAERSNLRLERAAGTSCETGIAVDMGDGRARLWTNGEIPCSDGTRLAELALTCAEAKGGDADCSGRYAIDRPIRVALVRVGQGKWPEQPKTPNPQPVPKAEPKATAPPEPAQRSFEPSAKPSPDAGAQDATPRHFGASDSGTAPAVQAPAQSPLAFADRLAIGVEGPEMIPIPAGCFLMGSPPDEPKRHEDEGPQHRVCLEAFSMGRTEVTFEQFDRFAEATGRRKPPDGWGRGNRPVINVRWQDAADYAQWLSGQTGQRYRLPTEAEWEYAARAGTQTPFWTGRCIHTDQANYDGRGSDYAGCGAATGVDRRQKTVTAASLPSNPWGLHEVAGNVWEWTQDCWHESYLGSPTDGSAWLDSEGGDCARRVVRGGGWDYSPGGLRSAARGRSPAVEASYFLGFRLARTP